MKPRFEARYFRAKTNRHIPFGAEIVLDHYNSEFMTACIAYPTEDGMRQIYVDACLIRKKPFGELRYRADAEKAGQQRLKLRS